MYEGHGIMRRNINKINKIEGLFFETGSNYLALADLELTM